MAHKALIGGVGRGLTGGRCLVNGVGHKIAKGRTLVGGVGYDVAFGPEATAIAITGTGNSSRCFVTIDGAKYTSAATLTVPAGTVVACTVSYTINQVEANGTVVLSRSGTYEYTTVGGPVEIALFYSFSQQAAIITITEG